MENKNTVSGGNRLTDEQLFSFGSDPATMFPSKFDHSNYCRTILPSLSFDRIVVSQARRAAAAGQATSAESKCDVDGQ